MLSFRQWSLKNCDLHCASVDFVDVDAHGLVAEDAAQVLMDLVEEFLLVEECFIGYESGCALGVTVAGARTRSFIAGDGDFVVG